MNRSDEIQSVLTGLADRQPAMRAVFAVDLAADGVPTFSVAPLSELTPDQQDRWHSCLRQVADLMREVLDSPGVISDEQVLPHENAPATEPTEKLFCYSADEEHFHGDCNSREEAIATGFERYPDADEIYVGTQVRSSAHHYVNGESILTLVSEDAGDEAGEWAEDWLWGSDVRADEKVLELEQLVGDWIQANDPPQFYMVEDSELVQRPTGGAA